MPSGAKQFFATLNDSLLVRGVSTFSGELRVDQFKRNQNLPPVNFFHVETSPPLDSMSYWFLKRSINLYGEAFAKTMAFRSAKTASSENGAEVISDHWSGKGLGIEKTELNMHDGSGLSPLNRVTTHAQVIILQYARKQPWFESYFNGFPEYNGMKMKSGTINGVKGFCGYHKSRSGKEYIFSFLVNNYNGSASQLVQKMYRVLEGVK
jgi:D-alanyl-D-alanine carboxypeptidase/D-alanyl-D-alanine-endopeptidase (penicillin-binding protein 4)